MTFYLLLIWYSDGNEPYIGTTYSLDEAAAEKLRLERMGRNVITYRIQVGQASYRVEEL